MAYKCSVSGIKADFASTESLRSSFKGGLAHCVAVCRTFYFTDDAKGILKEESGKWPN